MPLRDVSLRKLINPHFVGVICFIIFNYYVFVFEFMLGQRPSYMYIALVVFHILFIMLLWSMVHSIIADPGRVPIYWGFFAEEADNRRRRYCLLCHSFKPERCHHCSTCQRCVLNMDHHCPWISNCVGYTNRKFFILFLFYIIVTLITIMAFCLPILVRQFINFYHDRVFNVHLIIMTISMLMQIGFFIAIIMFFKFHVELVLSNSSTLDNLERRRNNNVGPNVYNLGSYENFVQVFGTNVWMWPFPIFGSSPPKGDGVLWRRNELARQ